MCVKMMHKSARGYQDFLFWGLLKALHFLVKEVALEGKLLGCGGLPQRNQDT